MIDFTYIKKRKDENYDTYPAQICDCGSGIQINE